MRKHFNLETPEVKAILCDVWRSSKKSYYRIDPVTGRHVVANLKQELVAIGMHGVDASALLQSGKFPVGKFKHNRPPQGPKLPPIARAIETEIEVYELALPVSIVTVEPTPLPVLLEQPTVERRSTGQCDLSHGKKKTGPKPISDEEREAKLALAIRIITPNAGS
jgi:hypothetical protein